MTNILNSSDLQLRSLASLEEKGKKVAFISGNRRTSAKNIKQKEQSFNEFGMNLTPLIYVEGEKVVSDGKGKLHLFDPSTKEEIKDEDASNYIALIDGQHRYTAALNSSLDHRNIILMKDYSGVDTMRLIASLNNDVCTWSQSEWAQGAYMSNPNNEVAQFAHELFDKGFKATTIGLILCLQKGKIGNKTFSAIMNGEDVQFEYDIERAKAFLHTASKKFEDSFIKKRYLIDVVSSLCAGRDYTIVLDAVDKLSAREVSAINGAKSDDKEGLIMKYLKQHLSEQNAA